jgi:2-oxo-3-hexenedioate decarboxylase
MLCKPPSGAGYAQRVGARPGGKSASPPKPKCCKWACLSRVSDFSWRIQSARRAAPLPRRDLVHPRVECEIAFFTKAELRGPGCTAEHVLAATDYVVPALEIIDSRFSGFKFDLPSVIADNGSSARFVPGTNQYAVDALDLCAIHVTLEKNGELVTTGISDAVLGNPAIAIAMLVNLLAEQGETLPAQSFVMSGAITEAIPVKAGDSIRAVFNGMGEITTQFRSA